MAQNYQRPMTPESRAQLLLSYGEKTKKDREALLKDVLGAARYMKSGSVMDQAAQQLVLGGMIGKQMPKNPGSMRGEAIDDWKVIAEGQKVQKDFAEGESLLNQLDANLSRGDLQALTSSIPIFARQIGQDKGVLSDSDVARHLPNVPGLTLAKIESWITNNPNVLLDRKVLKGLKELSAIARKGLKAKMLERLNSLKGSMANSPSFAGKTNRLDPVIKNIETSQGPTSGPSISEMIKQQIADEMKAGKK